MSTSEGIVKDVITPLVKRLDNVLRLIGDATGSSDINISVGRIKKQLESLKKDFEHENAIERRASEDFGVVWQHVDDMLEKAKAAAEKDSDRSTQLGLLQEHLEQIGKDIIHIIEEKGKTKPRFSTPDAQEDANVAGSRAAAAASDSERNASSSEAKKQQQLQAEIRIQESDAMSHLRLVIENLDTQLKHCLFCLTIFPEESVIKKRLLIHWWIGENIVRNAEDGKKCFDELSVRSLIIPVKKKHCEREHRCKVHPWIHKLLVSIAKSNAFLEFDSDGTPSDNYSRTHRAFLRKGRTLVGRSNQKNERGNEPDEDEEEEDEEEEDDEEDKALTLYNIDAKYVEFENSWFAGKKDLGALQLGRWQSSDEHHIEISGKYFLEDLGACKNLRYLSLRGMSRVESLPDSISNLGKLAVLDLRACHNLEKLTPKVSSLENLEYLDVSECYLLDQLPKGLKHLTKLEVLKGFVIAHATGKDPCRLSELATLEKLRKLSVSVGHESNEGELQILTNEFKASLTSLTITWGVVVSKKTTETTAKTTTPAPALSKTLSKKISSGKGSETKSALPTVPLGKLEKLDIRGYPGDTFPEWINPRNLPSLKKLYIRGGKLTTLGDVKEWRIEVLRLRFLNHLSCDANTKKDLFTKLRFLETQQCLLLSSPPISDKVTVVTDGAGAPDAAPQTQAAPNVLPEINEVEEED